MNSLAALKILSYFTVLFPLLFGGLYLGSCLKDRCCPSPPALAPPLPPSIPAPAVALPSAPPRTRECPPLSQYPHLGKIIHEFAIGTVKRLDSFDIIVGTSLWIPTYINVITADVTSGDRTETIYTLTDTRDGSFVATIHIERAVDALSAGRVTDCRVRFIEDAFRD